MDNIDVNLDHYTIDELLEIADLTYLSSDEEVVNVFTKYIKKYIRDKDFKLAQFFHDAKVNVCTKNKHVKYISVLTIQMSNFQVLFNFSPLM